MKSVPDDGVISLDQAAVLVDSFLRTVEVARKRAPLTVDGKH